jgi:hypothetical protein
MLLALSIAFAGDAALPAEARAADVVPAPAVAPPLRFLGVVNVRGVLTDVVTTNPLVTGQVIGELGGTNSTTTAEESGAYTEQRVGAFFTYTPALLDGRASLDAGFEVDFAWGDQSYATGGNTGGAFGGDQVNLQTRRLGARVEWFEDQTVVAGLQFVGDSVNDPATSRLDDLVRSGGGLSFIGSEATGVAAYGKLGDRGGERFRYRAGVFTLYEQAFAEGDDVTLIVGDAQFAPAHATRLGVHAWAIRDRAGGAAGIAGSGPASSLSELQGGPRLDFRADASEAAPEVDTDIVWLAADAGYNSGLDMGRFGVRAVAVMNTGRIYVADRGDVDILGGYGDVEARFRFASGSGSVARVEAVLASADSDGDDVYTGVLTANSWGVAGAFHATHGCYLLFPDTGSINRAVAVVADVSGGGRGLFAVTGGMGWDAIPERLNVAVGAGHARNATGGLGTEANLRVSGRPFPLGTVALVGAGVVGTDLPVTPWTAMLTFDWLVPG